MSHMKYTSKSAQGLIELQDVPESGSTTSGWQSSGEEDDSYSSLSEYHRIPSLSDLEQELPQKGRSWPAQFPKVYLLALVIMMSNFVSLYLTNVISSALVEMSLQGSGISDYELDTTQQSAIVSTIVAFSILGAVASGALQTKLLGRKQTLMVACGFIILGDIVVSSSKSVKVVVIGRALHGLACGIIMHSAPLFLAEVAPTHLRGLLNSANAQVGQLGQVGASVVGCLCVHADLAHHTLNKWRGMFTFASYPAAITLIAFLFVPESPRWLYSVKGDIQAARRSLIWITGGVQEANVMLDSFQVESSSSTTGARQMDDRGILSKLCAKRTRNAMKLGLGLMMMQQLAGINALMFFAASILKLARGSVVEASGAELDSGDVENVCETVLFPLCQFCGNMICTALVDKLGRRKLAIVSCATSSFCLYATGLVFHAEVVSGRMLLVMVCAYQVGFGLGMGPLPWTVNAEIYPMQTKSIANAIAVLVLLLTTFFVIASFLPLSIALSTRDKHPDGVYWMFAAFSTIGTILMVKFMPETCGKSEDQMEQLFS